MAYGITALFDNLGFLFISDRNSEELGHKINVLIPVHVSVGDVCFEVCLDTGYLTSLPGT